MSAKLVYILCSLLVSLETYVLCLETREEKNSILTCGNGTTDCEASESFSEFGATTIPSGTEASESAFEVLNDEKYPSVDNATSVSSSMSTMSTTPLNSVARPTAKPKFLERSRNEGGICSCDLTIYSCDINCCCDLDCADLDVEKIFNCEDDNKYRLKITGTRYCYDGSYIAQNKTRYLLEKLRDNLFCIAYDNLPPLHTAEYDPIITDRITFEEILNNNKESKFKFEHSANNIPSQFPMDNNKPYRYGDIIWRMRNKSIKKLELPQSGFTGVCSLKKALKYLEDWSDSCLQISLENSNERLFVEGYINLAVIASPSLYNDSNFTFENQSCPRNICIPLESHYCFIGSGSNIFCGDKNGGVDPPPPVGKCYNGSCTNVVKSIRYVIMHSGKKGIEAVKVYLNIGNAREKFYQKFEVEYKWLRDEESRIIHMSGNPGYITGKPIILGNILSTNKTGDSNRSHVVVDKNERFLSLPVAAMDGKCEEDRRYVVNFGEDLKLNCRIEYPTHNFSVASCVDLQKVIVDALLKNILLNVTRYVDKHSSAYLLAKWNNNYLDENDDNMENWSKILFDRIIPLENVLTGQIIDDQIICSGLVTSIRIDIIHRRLPEPQPVDNYKILAAALTFSEDSDIHWTKCYGDNCTDILHADVVSYVIFHDVSQPSKYFFAEGPNFDINLPHDFFYPFINAARSINRSNNFISIVTIISCTFLAFDYYQ